jgi:hypothetical protein
VEYTSDEPSGVSLATKACQSGPVSGTMRSV